MPIVGFNFDKLSVERLNPIKGNVSVKNDLSIKNIEKEEVMIGSKKDTAIKFSFEFSSIYEPKIANIFVKGHILYMDNEKELKKILDDWKKKKDIDKKIASQVINTALIKSNIKVLHLSQDMNLPPHIRLPTINPQSTPKDYIG
jgi:hypothetical protein